MLLNSDTYHLVLGGPLVLLLALFCHVPRETEIDTSLIKSKDVGAAAWCSLQHPISWMYRELLIAGFGYCLIYIIFACFVGLRFLAILKVYDQVRASNHIEFDEKIKTIPETKFDYYHYSYLVYSMTSTAYNAFSILIICGRHPVLFASERWEDLHPFCTYKHDKLDWSAYQPCAGIDSCSVARYIGDHTSFASLYWMVWAALTLMMFVMMDNLMKVVRVLQWNQTTFVKMVYQDWTSDYDIGSASKADADLELGRELQPLATKTLNF